MSHDIKNSITDLSRLLNSYSYDFSGFDTRDVSTKPDISRLFWSFHNMQAPCKPQWIYPQAMSSDVYDKLV